MGVHCTTLRTLGTFEIFHYKKGQIFFFFKDIHRNLQQSPDGLLLPLTESQFHWLYLKVNKH